MKRSRGTGITELAASIARVGLLQNLAVITSPDGQWFEVVAGRRRLAALRLLVKRRKLAKDHPVPCLLVPDTSARTVTTYLLKQQPVGETASDGPNFCQHHPGLSQVLGLPLLCPDSHNQACLGSLLGSPLCRRF